MEAATPQESIRYLVEESGRRVGVVLSLEDYQELCAAQPHDPELLVGLSDAELETLADGILVPRLQDRLSHLLQLNQEGDLVPDQVGFDKISFCGKLWASISLAGGEQCPERYTLSI